MQCQIESVGSVRAIAATTLTLAFNLQDQCQFQCVDSVRAIERWGAGVETQKNVLGVFGGWGRVPFNEPYAPSLSTIYDGA